MKKCFLFVVVFICVSFTSPLVFSQTPPPGIFNVLPETKVATVYTNFETNVVMIFYAQPDDQVSIYYNQNCVSVDQEKGTLGLEFPSISGFDPGDPDTPNIVHAAGRIDVSNYYHGADSDSFKIHWKAIGQGISSIAVDPDMIYAETHACTLITLDPNCGDVNGDRMIDIIDALYVAQYYVGTPPVGFIHQMADVNADEAADIVDALLIAKYYVGLISEFTCGAPKIMQVLFLNNYLNFINHPYPYYDGLNADALGYISIAPPGELYLDKVCWIYEKGTEVMLNQVQTVFEYSIYQYTNFRWTTINGETIPSNQCSIIMDKDIHVIATYDVITN